MTERGRRIARIWPEGSPLVGMIHLLPLPGSPGWGGSMAEVLDRALADAGALTGAGFDGLVVENYGDTPFFGQRVPPETVAASAVIGAAVVDAVAVPVGVNVLRNDARAGVAVAAATGARFVRVNVHTGSMWTDQGLVEGRAAETLRARASLRPEVAILADVHVKHGVPPAGQSIGDAAMDTWSRGRADGLIVSGAGTGAAIDPEDLRAVRSAVPDAPIFVGSGATRDDAAALLEATDGLIVGSAVMREGRAGAGVDPGRARAFVDAARG